MFGLLVGANLVFAALGDTRDDQLVSWVLVGGSSILCVGGGVMFLFGVERRPGRTGRSLRIAGWILFSAGLLLPTSLVFFQLAAIIGGGVGALRRDRDDASANSDPHDNDE
jgi:hypothetical protein